MSTNRMFVDVPRNSNEDASCYSICDTNNARALLLNPDAAAGQMYGTSTRTRGDLLIVDHKCFCIETCFAFLAAAGFSVRQSRFRGLPQDAAVPSRCRRRDSLKNVNIKKYHRLVRFFAEKYDVAKPI